MNTLLKSAILVGGGVVIGAALNHELWRTRYNELVRSYNALLAKDRIKSDAFREILAKAPDSVDLFSEKLLTDIGAWNLFNDNDL